MWRITGINYRFADVYFEIINYLAFPCSIVTPFIWECKELPLFHNRINTIQFILQSVTQRQHERIRSWSLLNTCHWSIGPLRGENPIVRHVLACSEKKIFKQTLNQHINKLLLNKVVHNFSQHHYTILFIRILCLNISDGHVISDKPRVLKCYKGLNR